LTTTTPPASIQSTAQRAHDKHTHSVY